MDNHHNSGYPVAARFLRSEYQLKLPENWRLDSRSDRYRRHTHWLTAPWGGKNLAQPPRARLCQTSVALDTLSTRMGTDHNDVLAAKQ